MRLGAFRLPPLRGLTSPSQWLFPICETRLMPNLSSVVVMSEFGPILSPLDFSRGCNYSLHWKIQLAGFLKQPEFVIPIQMLNNTAFSDVTCGYTLPM